VVKLAGVARRDRQDPAPPARLLVSLGRCCCRKKKKKKKKKRQRSLIPDGGATFAVLITVPAG
jgi:hypothetical protein